MRVSHVGSRRWVTLTACVAALWLSASSTRAQDNGVSACLKACRDSAKACNSPVIGDNKDCAQACRDAMKTALQGCKTDPDPSTCIGNAYTAAEACHEACAGTAQASHETCFNTTNDCIKACTSDQGDCIVGCRESTRNCTQSGHDAAATCKDSCRETLQTMLQGCPSATDPGTCVKAARDAAKACRTPCLDALKAAATDCKAQAHSCTTTCAPAP